MMWLALHVHGVRGMLGDGKIVCANFIVQDVMSLVLLFCVRCNEFVICKLLSYATALTRLRNDLGNE